MPKKAKTIIENYYKHFNDCNMDAFLDLLDDDVVHDINQGKSEKGKLLFKAFMEHMFDAYEEKVNTIVIMVDDEGKHVAATYICEGTYLKTDEYLPQATGQYYKLSAATFFEISREKITRVTTYYNVKKFIQQVLNG